MHRKVLRLATASALTLALAALTACPNRDVAAVKPKQNRQQNKVIPESVNRDLDILFVVDNSLSMAPLQVDLVKNFPKFINVLQGIQGGLPNLHIGVVSSDVGGAGSNYNGSGGDPACSGNGDDGALQNKPCGMRTDHTGGPLPGCDASCTGPTDPWIVDTNGGKTVNFSGTLASTFSCIADLGDTGCGFEMHLESMRRAFDFMRNPKNKGFLRDGAYLAIIIIGNEDDCSVADTKMLDPQDTKDFGAYASYRCTQFGVVCQPDDNSFGPHTNCKPRENSKYMHHVQDYINFISGLKSSPDQVIVAGITGPSTPFAIHARMGGGCPATGCPELTHSCLFSSAIYADPAVRINTFVKAFSHSTYQTICTDDFSPALMQIATLLAQVVGNPCLEGDLLDSSGTPVTKSMKQPDCQVSDVQFKDQPNQKETVVPHCSSPSDTSRCWYAQPDAMKCSMTPTHLTLVLNGTTPSNDTVVAHCAAQ